MILWISLLVGFLCLGASGFPGRIEISWNHVRPFVAQWHTCISFNSKAETPNPDTHAANVRAAPVITAW